jgi:hypothetical protein
LAEQKRVVRPWLWALIGLVGALLVVSPASSAILTPHGSGTLGGPCRSRPKLEHACDVRFVTPSVWGTSAGLSDGSYGTDWLPLTPACRRATG